VGAARKIRAVEVVDPAERARRARIRASVDGILRSFAGRYGFDLGRNVNDNDGPSVPPGSAHQPGHVR
jgi:hypothetical protein